MHAGKPKLCVLPSIFDNIQILFLMPPITNRELSMYMPPPT